MLPICTKSNFKSLKISFGFVSKLFLNVTKNATSASLFLSGSRISFSSFTVSNKVRMENNSKSICFADYDAVGFDCDHTIAQYNLYHLFEDTFEAMANYLVKEKGYKKEIFSFNPSFCSRGTILDLKTGNFMKLAHDGKILRAFHGTRPLPKEEYSSQTWPHYEEVSNTMTNIGIRYRIFENFFDMASSLLCAQIIDHLDEKYNKEPEFYDVWPDVLSAIRFVYIPDPFKAKNGKFFTQWIKDKSRYMEKCSDKLKEWLKKMKLNNRPMFILSSAYEDMADATLKFVLGDDWQEYFDLSVFLAEKPRFFYEDNPFYHLSHSCEQTLVTDLNKDKKFYGGNLKDLVKHLSLLTGKPNPKVLFFGDSMRSDVIPSKHYANWDTVFILEEMACETCFYRHRTDNLLVEQCEYENPSVMPWGSIFIDGADNIKCDVENSRERVEKVQTFIHSSCQKYADIAVPNLEFLLDYPLDHKFTTFNAKGDPSLSGFHPFAPHPLK